MFRWSIRAILVNPLDLGVAPLGNMFRDIPDDEAAATVDAAQNTVPAAAGSRHRLPQSLCGGGELGYAVHDGL